MTYCALDQNGLTLRPGVCVPCVAISISIVFTMTVFCDMEQGLFSPNDFNEDDYERLKGFMRSPSPLIVARFSMVLMWFPGLSQIPSVFFFSSVFYFFFRFLTSIILSF